MNPTFAARKTVCFADKTAPRMRLSSRSPSSVRIGDQLMSNIAERIFMSSSELALTALLAFIGPILALYANGS